MQLEDLSLIVQTQTSNLYKMMEDRLTELENRLIRIEERLISLHVAPIAAPVAYPTPSYPSPSTAPLTGPGIFQPTPVFSSPPTNASNPILYLNTRNAYGPSTTSNT